MRLKKFNERGFLRTLVDEAGGGNGVVASWLNGTGEGGARGEANLMRSKKFKGRGFLRTSAGGMRGLEREDNGKEGEGGEELPMWGNSKDVEET